MDRGSRSVSAGRFRARRPPGLFGLDDAGRSEPSSALKPLSDLGGTAATSGIFWSETLRASLAMAGGFSLVCVKKKLCQASAAASV